jgi:hypothetical protein
MLIRVSIGRTINLGNFQSLRVDVAHEVAVSDHPDRAAAVAEAARLCREDLAALIAAETGTSDERLPPRDPPREERLPPRDPPRDAEFPDDGIPF